MARRKNLLEAFQRSQPSAGGDPGPGSAPSASAMPLFEAVAPGGGVRSGPAFAWPLMLVAVVLSFALGFVLGRGRPAEAHEDAPSQRAPSAPASQPRTFLERESAQPAPGAVPPAADPERIQDSALYDPANLYTVVVASYTKGKNNKNADLAWATYTHLKDAGLPVFRPVESGNLLVVLAGAAPTRAELESIETRGRALERDGQRPYFDTYRDRIDKLIGPRPAPGARPKSD